MDFEVMDVSIKNFIEILKCYGEKSLTLSMYGGEPLINKNNIFMAMEKYGNEYDSVKIEWIINTNGSLITDEILDFFKKYDVKVNISVDGTKEVHDKNRVDKFNKGTFERVESVLKMIKSKKIKAQINSFVFPENINNLCNIIALAKKFDIKMVYLDLFYDTQERAIPSDIISKKYFEAYEYGLKNNVQVLGPWSRLLKKSSNKKQVFYKTPRIKITVDGKFYFATLPLMKPLDLKYLNYDYFVNNYKTVSSKFFELVDDNCKYCFLRKECQGSMMVQFMFHTKLNKGWKRSCESIKEIIKLIRNN
jgi:sulfatase maturation enzyme AslB (radical SAM superfamily)